MRISSVSFDGKVSLSFNKEIVVPSNFSDILNVRNKTEVLNVISNEWALRLGDDASQKDFSLSVMQEQKFGNETAKIDMLQLVMLREASGEITKGT